MAERVVRHAVLAYTDPDGVNRMALRGDRIRIAGDELERAERFEAVVESEADLAAELAALNEDADEPSPADAESAGEDEDSEDEDSEDEDSEDEDSEDEDSEDEELERPPLTANKDAWVDFRHAESEGRLSKEQLNGLTKPELQDDTKVAGLQPSA